MHLPTHLMTKIKKYADMSVDLKRQKERLKTIMSIYTFVTYDRQDEDVEVVYFAAVSTAYLEFKEDIVRHHLFLGGSTVYDVVEFNQLNILESLVHHRLYYRSIDKFLPDYKKYELMYKNIKCNEVTTQLMDNE